MRPPNSILNLKSWCFKLNMLSLFTIWICLYTLRKWWWPFYIKMMKSWVGEGINLAVFQYSNAFDDLWRSKKQFSSIDEVRVKQWVICTARTFLMVQFQENTHTHTTPYTLYEERLQCLATQCLIGCFHLHRVRTPYWIPWFSIS